MLKDPPDLKAAAAFALISGQARVAIGQRDAGVQMFQQAMYDDVTLIYDDVTLMYDDVTLMYQVQMFQQAMNMARVALDPLGEVGLF
jgi:hypothetical protein